MKASLTLYMNVPRRHVLMAMWADSQTRVGGLGIQGT